MLQLEASKHQVFSKLHFIDESIISIDSWIFAEEIVQDIDIDDVDFVALTKFLKGTLWTGDKILYNGLRRKGFKKVVNTQELDDLKFEKE